MNQGSNAVHFNPEGQDYNALYVVNLDYNPESNHLVMALQNFRHQIKINLLDSVGLDAVVGSEVTKDTCFTSNNLPPTNINKELVVTPKM
jgi:hypothetical protein